MFGWPRGAMPGIIRYMQRRIVSLHQDAEGDWVAQLECGHRRHVRHRPPWFVRPWTTTPEGRERALGMPLRCRLCEQEGRSPVTGAPG